MTGEIYSVLKKIDSLIVEKFGLSKEVRIFLKKLLLDNNFLDLEIQKQGGVDNFCLILNDIYSKLLIINTKLEKIKDFSINNDSIKEILEKYFGEEFKEMEKRKENAINDYVSSIVKEDERNKKEEERINEILNKINN